MAVSSHTLSASVHTQGASGSPARSLVRFQRPLDKEIFLYLYFLSRSSPQIAFPKIYLEMNRCPTRKFTRNFSLSEVKIMMIRNYISERQNFEIRKDNQKGDSPISATLIRQAYSQSWATSGTEARSTRRMASAGQTLRQIPQP